MIKKISVKEEDYPEKLAKHLSDPKDIYYIGDLELLSGPSLGIVGTRKCSGYGLNVSNTLAKEASSRGVTVISGLARGIDTAAHKGTKLHGFRTIGVLANGIDVFYPAENRNLQLEMGNKALLISEYGETIKPRPFHFPIRNRLIAALSDVLVVVEAGLRSGALITAEAAIEQGKEVFSVPGKITSKVSIGTNKLIADGASPLVRIEDVFVSLGVKAKYKEAKLDKLGSLERLAVEIIVEESGEVSIGYLREKMRMTSAGINGLLTVLEMKGIVVCEMGKVYLSI